MNKEESKLDILFNLYAIKPTFEFLINLFIRSYNNKNNPFLLDFKNPKIVLKNIKICNKDFKDIYSNLENLMKNNCYEPIDFYGLLLCY